MPISSLVITLTDDQALADSACESLGARPEIELGRHVANRLAAVVDSADSEADRETWQWINALPGVAHVDVVFVHFDDPPREESPELHAEHRAGGVAP